ncbi:N-acetylmuramoyl-L-alanine amidase [Paenibacillus sp. GCM10012307]|uniref:N-acetylmuramoyl-L-alanine amidase n=1 Tax=Paenibacillus roseus TaxID=2798579 RepID=A0A934JCI3_9BACL|nr:N-acetylmuramoyl-L-alanine amidase [Paenibacillus roseus]MBJ6364295.1 N-acetylmuramoyl-L-alanine amidase [Paenibacillus roseus]
MRREHLNSKTGRYVIAFWLVICLFAVAGDSVAASRIGHTPHFGQQQLPEAQVLIDVGHGGIDGGTSYKDILEKDINLAVAKQLYLQLNSQGILTAMNRTGDYALSDDNRWHGVRSRHLRDLSQRLQLSREIHLQVMVSLHVNWARGSNKLGPLVLHQEDGGSALLASLIQEALNDQQHTNRLPQLGKPFYLLRQVKIPAVIIEMGFISNSHDRAMLTSTKGQAEVATAIAAGLRKYLLLIGG